MLDKVDLSKKLSKPDYEKVIKDLELRVGELQRQARSLGIPVMIVFEGWDAAGKGTLINRLLLSMDPRGFTVYPTNPPTEEERMRPFLWRFWRKTPARGRVAIYDRSWYGRVLVERVEKILRKKVWQRAFDEINSFEKLMADDGTVVVKFFLHISQKEQKKRFKECQKIPSTAWKVTKQDWKAHRKYPKYLEAMEEMLDKTDSAVAPWTVVEAHDLRFATVKVFRTLIETVERRVDDLETAGKAAKPAKNAKPAKPEKQASIPSVLDTVDMSVALSREEYKKQLKSCQQRMRELEHEVFLRRLPVVIAYEGWDAAGKGGNIKRLAQEMDPRGYEVIPVAAPNDIEKAHHYLWRFWINLPKAGHIAIFDRTWYGRVMVERIEGYCSAEEWRRAFAEIRDMEEQMTNFGTVLVKFWLNIDKEEQLKRFKERQKLDYKQWKITDEDWRNREKWDKYRGAVDEMLYRTSTAWAPWTIIESNCKWHARVKTLKTVIEAIEKKL
jgi:AMP-polyphosphate phosphotransferase